MKNGSNMARKISIICALTCVIICGGLLIYELFNDGNIEIIWIILLITNTILLIANIMDLKKKKIKG